MLHEARQSLLDQLAKTKATSESDTSADGDPADAAVTKEMDNEDGKNLVDKVIAKVLETAAKQWSHAAASHAFHRHGSYATNSHMNVAQIGKVNRIIEIIDQAITTDNKEICRTLIIDILKNTGTSPEKFVQIYKPLIPPLRILLHSKNLDIYAPPFVDLFQILIGSYLRVVLGEKGQHLNLRLRKIGCGCQDCQPLDKFILDPKTEKTTFRLVQKRRLHLEAQLSKASDICSYETIKSGNPHGVQVTKLTKVVQASKWESRQKEAKTFLSTIGTDEVIKKIMGVRYSDVIAAINGTVSFGATKIADVGSSASTSTAVSAERTNAHRGSSHAGPSGSRIKSSHSGTNLLKRNPTSAPPLAGKKRKSNPAAVDLGVLDLTDS